MHCMLYITPKACAHSGLCDANRNIRCVGRHDTVHVCHAVIVRFSFVSRAHVFPLGLVAPALALMSMLHASCEMM